MSSTAERHESSYALSSIRMMQSSLPGRSPYFGTEIDPKRLQEAIMEAEKLYPNLKAVEELRLFIESFTHFNDSEYAQSFVLSWSIIERHLYELWTRNSQRWTWTKTGKANF